MGDWIVKNFLQPFFYWLDKIIYGFIQDLYNLFFQISNVSLLSDTTVANFAQRIYVIIGVFMLFKVAISLITMLVSPDSMSKGGPTLIKRIVVALVLLVLTPNIFTLGYRIQSYIIQDNVLGNLILGSASDTGNVEQAYVDGGQIIALQVFKGFFHPKSTADNSVEVKTREDCGDAAEDDEACIYATAETIEDFGDIIGSDNYSYSFLISTIAGGFVAWMILMYCFDLAVRAVKLSFLQLIAPVPILANIEESKGSSIFKNWVSQSVSCFLSIFIRLITIYFIIFVISELVGVNGLGYYTFDAELGEFVYMSGYSNWLLSAFVIIGLLLFAKQVPQLIEDITGIKSEKAFSAGKMGMFGAALAGSVGGAIVGGAANLGNYMAGRRALKNEINAKNGGNWKTEDYEKLNAAYGSGLGAVGRALRTTAGGMGSSGVRAGLAAGKGKGIMAGISAARLGSIQARNNRAMGYGLKDKAINKFTDFTGTTQTFGSQDERKGKIKELMEKKKNAELSEKTNAELFRSRLQQVDARLQPNLTSLYAQNEDGSYKIENVDWNTYVQEVAKKQELITDDDIKNHTTGTTIDETFMRELESQVSDSLVDRDMFEAINSANVASRESDKIAQKLEKDITKLKEMNDIGKKKS